MSARRALTHLLLLGWFFFVYPSGDRMLVGPIARVVDMASLAECLKVAVEVERESGGSLKAGPCRPMVPWVAR